MRSQGEFAHGLSTGDLLQRREVIVATFRAMGETLARRMDTDPAGSKVQFGNALSRLYYDHGAGSSVDRPQATFRRGSHG